MRRVAGSDIFEERENGVYTKVPVRVPPGAEFPAGQFVSAVPIKLPWGPGYIADLVGRTLVVEGQDPVEILDVA